MVNDSVFEREDTSFESRGIRCAAWLYQPENSAVAGSEDPPVVVMAHGFGTTRRMGLSSYAERFAERGPVLEISLVICDCGQQM
jgi:poly(3-hydroxybutyrate) depolymerase